jgi:hypothetical protein
MVKPSFSIVGRCIDDSRFAILIALASLAVGHVPCSPISPRFGCSRVQMTFIEAMRTQLLGSKRMLGNIRQSAGAISGAIACNSDDGICRPRGSHHHPRHS